MDIKNIIYGISGFLVPFIPSLVKEEAAEEETDADGNALRWAGIIWDKIKRRAKSRPPLRDAMREIGETPFDGDAMAALRLQLRKLAAEDEELAKELAGLWHEMEIQGVAVDLSRELHAVRWLDVLNGGDDVLKRLEMVRLLRSGMPPEEVAAQLHTDVEYMWRVHSAFSLSGVYGILSGSNIRHWLDNLNKADPMLRRLEMIRLLKAGTPVETISKEYHAAKEYILRLNDHFTRHGTIGILNEDDFRKFRTLNPPLIKVCSFNLHGTHKGDAHRLKRIANELSVYDPELCAFQEVISGGGIEETSAQISNWMTKITGCHYRTFYAYCHPFMEKYPEGVAVASKTAFSDSRIIDLNKGLRDNVRPMMERFAASAAIEIYGKRIIFTSVHLDHGEDSTVRLAQAEKLVNELDKVYGTDNHYCSIIAGDYNDVESSSVIEFLKDKGFVDAFRQCHRTGGNTFTSDNPFTRIDYFMVRGNVEIRSAELILKDPALSDHIGLFAVIG